VSSIYGAEKHWIGIGPEGGDIRALAVDPSSSQTVYISAGGGIYKSIDGGNSWRPMSIGLPQRCNVRVLMIDPLAPQTLYASTFKNGVFKSTNGGNTWVPVNTGLANMTINALKIHPENPHTIYAGTNGGVFMSINGGSDWSAVNEGPDRSINALAIDPSSETVYAGTDGRGVFKITDGGHH
jgi:photosystem II stability/assembly factor-like uncharacterized protein